MDRSEYTASITYIKLKAFVTIKLSTVAPHGNYGMNALQKTWTHLRSREPDCVALVPGDVLSRPAIHTVFLVLIALPSSIHISASEHRCQESAWVPLRHTATQGKVEELPFAGDLSGHRPSRATPLNITLTPSTHKHLISKLKSCYIIIIRIRIMIVRIIIIRRVWCECKLPRK